MKKRVLIVMGVVAFVLAMTTPVYATVDVGEEEVKEDIRPCWDGSTVDPMCIPYTRVAATLEAGKVEVDEAGIVKIEIKGVSPNATFLVYFGDWDPNNWWRLIGTFTTDGDGEWDDTFSYVFGPGDYQGKFAFNYWPSSGLRQFITEEVAFVR